MPDDPVKNTQLQRPETEDRTAKNIRPSPEYVDAGSLATSAEPTAAAPRRAAWAARVQGSDLVIVLAGDWLARQTGVAEDMERHVRPGGASRTLLFEATALGHWDSALIVFLWDLQAVAARLQIAFDESGLPEPARRLLALASVESAHEAAKHAPRETLLHRTGQGVITGWHEVVEVLDLLGDTLLRAGPAFAGRGGLRHVDVLECAWEAGISAVPIVTVVNVLVGGILAFVGAAQLRRFGAGIYVADLVGLAVVREMAAVMTAIIMSGRTGAAYAARIATMQGNEEIDALHVAGIPVFDYLVLPRVTALTCMMPILYLYGCLVGIIGGVTVACLTLQLSIITFLQEMRTAVDAHQFVLGLTKSVVFGAVIAFTGCRIGLRSGRSAADVGRAATAAVVVGIVCVIALDALFAVCADRLGI
jgi:phospholipid/cholesterol/gamma-HCH transport system permease protein